MGARPKSVTFSLQGSIAELEKRADKCKEFIKGRPGTSINNLLTTYDDNLTGLGQQLYTTNSNQMAKSLGNMSLFYNKFTHKDPEDLLVAHNGRTIQEIQSIRAEINKL